MLKPSENVFWKSGEPLEREEGITVMAAHGRNIGGHLLCYGNPIGSA